MNYHRLAKEIRKGYAELKKDTIYKLYHVTWNNQLETSEITVENDSEFKVIIIGNTRNQPGARGYMYLFYTSDRRIPFPSLAEIERRLRTVSSKKILDKKDSSYFDWEEYGTLE